jgi:putative DNA primase/helicase
MMIEPILCHVTGEMFQPARIGLMGNFALGYADRGVPVFPCGNDKQPLVASGFKAATTDPEKILAWWQQCPTANIAARPIDDRCIVLDVDPKNEPDPAEVKALPPTRTVRTPSGGYHFYYKTDVEFGNRKFAKGIDVRCAAGYVLLPGSVVNGNAYLIEDDREPVPLPVWIRDRLTAPPERLAADVEAITADRLIGLLSDIDPDCDHDTWKKILAAISTLEIDSFETTVSEIALAWSAGEYTSGKVQPANYCGDDYDMASTLASFGPKAGGSTIATLVHMAREAARERALEKWSGTLRVEAIKANLKVVAPTLAAINTADLDDPEIPRDMAAAVKIFRDRYFEETAPGEFRAQLPSDLFGSLADLIAKYGVSPDTTALIMPNLRFSTATEPEKIDWLWNGWLARGKLHILAGAPGAGKSTIAFDLAATISRGGEWPDGSRAPLGRAVIWSAEDTWTDVILPRIMAAGGDRSRVHHIEGYQDRAFDPATDLAGIYEALTVYPDISLLILDPVLNVVTAESRETAKTRRDLTPLVTLLGKANIPGLGISHFTKNSDKQDPLDRVVGSGAFGAYARLVMAAAKGIDDEAVRKLVRVKSNIGPDGGGFEYRLTQETLPGYGFEAQKIIWGGRLTGRARDLLGSEAKRSELSEAYEFLVSLLQGGRVSAKDIDKALKANDISPITVRRAKKRFGGIRTFQLDGGWYSELLPTEADGF